MMVWRYDMYGLRRHQLAQALGSGDEKTFFPDTNEIKSIPTRSSMQHKDQRSLKIISPETLSIYLLPVLPNWTAKSSKVPYARHTGQTDSAFRNSELFQMPSEAAASPGTNVQGKKPLLEHDRGTRCSSCSSVLKCIHLIIDRRARWPTTDVLSAVMSKESFTRW